MSNVMLIDPFCKNPKYESPNLKLGYCCSVLQQKGHQSTVFDFLIKDIEKIDNENKFDEIKSKFLDEIENSVIGNYQYVYINCEYGLLSTCIEIAMRLKGKCILIIGGTFINYLYEGNRMQSLLELDIFNYISLGDAENDIIHIVNRIDTFIIKKIGNTAFYKSSLIHDLDSIPFPLWSKFDLNKYDGKLYLIASKGCKYNKCTFCDEKLIWGNKFRCRKAEKIVSEIRHNIEQYKANEYFFWDASITSYHNTKELCNMLIELGINCSWTALARAEEITEDSAHLLKESGCHTIEIGIETLTDKTLKSMNKGVTVDTIKRAVKILKNAGIKVEGSFLIGYIGDSEYNIMHTINEAKKLQLDSYRWHNLSIPSDYLKKNSHILNKGWHSLDLNYPNQFLHKKIIDNPSGYFDMHIVSKMNQSIPEKYPDIVLGNLSIKKIHDLTRLAIKETVDISTTEGHNPYI